MEPTKRPQAHEVWGIKKDPTTWFYVYDTDELGYSSFNLLRRIGYHWSNWSTWPRYYKYIGGEYALSDETLFPGEQSAD